MVYYRTHIKNEASKGTEKKLNPPKAAKGETRDDSAEIRKASEQRMLGGRPKGSTNVKQKITKRNLVAT